MLRENGEVNRDYLVLLKNMKGIGSHCKAQGQIWALGAPPAAAGMWFGGSA